MSRYREGGWLCRVAAAAALIFTLASPVGAADDKKPELALKGFCPAAYLLAGAPRKGDPAHQMVYQGRLYYFSSAEAMGKFKEAPETYHPRIGGLCTLALGGSYGNRFDGDPEVYDIRDGKVYLFSLQRAKNSYVKDPDRYIKRAEELWAEPAANGMCPVTYTTDRLLVRGDRRFRSVFRGTVFHLASEAALKAFEEDPTRFADAVQLISEPPELEGNCPVAVQSQRKLVKGDPRYRLVHEGNVYQFVSSDAMDAFQKDPNRYIPQYGGFCAEGVSRGLRFPGPTATAVYEAKTYLFFDAAAKKKFEADPKAMIELADARWARIKDQK